MKAFLIGISLVIGMSISSGCQSQSQANESDQKSMNTTNEVLAPEVQIIANEQVEKGKRETISAVVTVGDEFVDEADVEFEIKRDEESEKITANSKDKGKYTIDYTFKSDGQYEIIAHTNAEGYHIMPSMQIQVGDSDTDSSPKQDEKSETSEHHHNHEEEH
ncbi:FixH family protein [Metabacillus halosaccharovorans]|uniref:FixH family protein n=1 Tax=Metabacillus halosaccharovorans TaxID=930124 RepID=A0ABT3DPE8_9BACI|nr:FixH family protein [Metabacillus halosaccharovorans]MCV9888940.1 FixH family protein [Metabacillus halosaccharovorans]